METVGSQSSVGSPSEVNQLREEMKRLQEDVRSLRGHLSQMSESVKERGLARAQEGMDKLSGELKSAYGNVRERGQRARASIENEIEERPFTSVAGALIAGIILGKILSSRH